MARKRTSAAELAGLLNSAKQPIYIVDDEQVIVFCNRACLEWVGLSAAELQGQRTAYHSESELDGADAAAAGLCPPPLALAGREITATVAVAGPDGQVRQRGAQFIPLGESPDDVICVVALVDSEDLTEAEPSVEPFEEPDSLELHERIRRFRRRAIDWHAADRLVGESPAARRVRAQVELAAGSRASVQVVGPPGSGRHHLAGTIHYLGPSMAGDLAAGGALLPLACSSLDADLICSTVTALAAKNPLGERAAGSTLLLNDADLIPAGVQSELAAILGAAAFPLRLVATARHPLADLARSGRYRTDLAALLGTMVIELVPLAERREDLPLLAQMFLEDANAKNRKQVGGFLPEALDALDAYAWPGNIDELAQIVAEAHRNAAGPLLGPADLPKRIHLAADAAAHPHRIEQTIVLDDLLADIERELIGRAIDRAKGNKAKAARLLGLTRPRLYRRLVQLGLAEGEGDD